MRLYHRAASLACHALSLSLLDLAWICLGLLGFAWLRLLCLSLFGSALRTSWFCHVEGYSVDIISFRSFSRDSAKRSRITLKRSARNTLGNLRPHVCLHDCGHRSRRRNAAVHELAVVARTPSVARPVCFNGDALVTLELPDLQALVVF